jgi:hypothetical protein
VFVADPEPGDGHMIGGAVGGQDPKGDVFLAAAFDLAGGADPGAVAIQEHGQQHPGRIGGPTMPVGPIGLEERTKVELVDHVQDEPGQMVGRQPVTYIGWEQERLVAVAGKEVVDHGRSYAIGLLCFPTTGLLSSRSATAWYASTCLGVSRQPFTSVALGLFPAVGYGQTCWWLRRPARGR